MDGLSFSTFLQILQPVLKEHNRQESAGTFLLDAINKNPLAIRRSFWSDNISAKKISRLVSRQDPVPDVFQQASLVPEIADGVKDYFESNVVPDLNPYTYEDALEKLTSLIEMDESIGKTKKKSLLALREKGQTGKFLAECFLYVLNRPNKKTDDEVSVEDTPLLAEANYECPICHRQLVETVKGTAVKKYEITQIYPHDLPGDLVDEFNAILPRPINPDSQDNHIALCNECAMRYAISPTVAEYSTLTKVKAQLVKNYRAKEAANKIDLEESIRTILTALITLDEPINAEPLSYDVLRLDEKISPNNSILRNEAKSHVLRYYRYIESVFSESGADFDTIAAQIKVCSKNYENAGLSQDEVVDHLAEWIRQKSGIGEKSKLACLIVVSFFIQNCEVFHK